MRLSCDVCNDSDAAVFCSADEAALCGRCDVRVHCANKLASRHQRFSIVIPQAEETPPCDICRDRRAFLFCQQDRAILCVDCDLSTHSANEHANKHDRFVLTGLKFSNFSQTHGKSADESLSDGYEFDAVPDFNPKVVPGGGTVLDQSKSNAANSLSSSSMVDTAIESVDLSNACSSGSLSEYLTETLPGWQVDEFLKSCCVSSSNCKDVDDFLDPADMGSNLSFSGGVSSQNWGFWVPQTSPGVYSTGAVEEVEPNPLRESKAGSSTRNYPKRWFDDGGFTVPQISPAVIAGCKKIRTLQ